MSNRKLWVVLGHGLGGSLVRLVASGPGVVPEGRRNKGQLPETSVTRGRSLREEGSVTEYGSLDESTVDESPRKGLVDRVYHGDELGKGEIRQIGRN